MTGRNEDHEQQLVDIMFSIAIMVHCDPRFDKLNSEGVAQYVRDQLRGCGWEVMPVGSSHGIIIMGPPE